MVDHMNVGFRRHVLKLPAAVGRRRVRALTDRARSIMAELSDEDRSLHLFLATQLPLVGLPLTPAWIGGQRDIAAAVVAEQLDRLGQRKALIARNAVGDVTWVYPVTVDSTPHHLTFESGDRLDAA